MNTGAGSYYVYTKMTLVRYNTGLLRGHALENAFQSIGNAATSRLDDLITWTQHARLSPRNQIH